MNKKQKSLIGLILCVVTIVSACFVAVFGYDSEGRGSVNNIILGLDLRGGVSITYEIQGDVPSAEDMGDTLRKLQQRAGIMSNESDVYQQGDNRIVVDIPGQNDKKKVSEALGKPGSISFVTGFGTDKAVTQISGSDIADAKAVYYAENGALKYMVSLTLTDAATSKFKQVTSANIGKEMAIVYDGEAISKPIIKEAISDGQCTIDGMKSMEEAEELASMIRIGSLKVELKELYSSVVGPRLGEKALETSLFAGAIGILCIVIFMIVMYRIPGIAAGLSLILYIALELLALNAFDTTLTLPGIAGIILSIGMAVDANVIIYARIREEIAEGNSIEFSIKNGFKKSTSAILDGNITTFIAAGVLYLKGSGTVKGFAETLAIGIALSMFTAMVASRIIVTLLCNLGAKKVSMYGVTKERKVINFVGKKNVFFAISLALILVGVSVLGLNKFGVFNGRKDILNYSVEFEGGITTTVDFDKKYTINEFNEKIKPEIAAIIGNNDITGTSVDNSNQYIIRTKTMDDETLQKMIDMLNTKFGASKDADTTTVSATIGKEMRNNALIAVGLATIGMLIYIFLRFKDMSFAVAAIVALVHDVLIALAFYAISWTNVGNTFIAVMLTIIGYSINATIVIFDRIRENLEVKTKKESIADVVNKSITQTLTRSIYTSFTTFITVFFLCIFGVAAIREFSIPFMVGIIVGAYSSVCIAGALWYVMAKNTIEAKMAKRKAEKLKEKDKYR